MVIMQVKLNDGMMIRAVVFGCKRNTPNWNKIHGQAVMGGEIWKIKMLFPLRIEFQS
jgi:hypothetical protein